MTTFQVRQETFEGPLELLLELIEKEKLSINKISLARVTNDYIAHVGSLEEIDPEALAEFLVVAAQLMLVKSRSLLPGLALSEEEEESIEEFEKRVEEYRVIREFAKGIQSLLGHRRWIVTREAYTHAEPVFYPPPALRAEGIWATFASLLAALPQVEKLVEEKIRRVISLEEKVNHIKAIFQSAIERGFSEIVRGAKEKVDIIVSFLAILELANQKFLDIRQDKLFEEIVVKKST